MVGLDEDDIQLFLGQYNSKFITYEIPPGMNTNKDTSEDVYTMGDHEGTLQIENDDISMKTQLFLNPFGGTFGTLRFAERPFISNLLGLTPYLDYKPTNAIHADSPGVYTSDKSINLITIDKIHL